MIRCPEGGRSALLFCTRSSASGYRTWGPGGGRALKPHTFRNLAELCTALQMNPNIQTSNYLISFEIYT